ncbi:phage tail protein [Pseudomonas sp. YH-1]|uniref:phage tail protein n=1 Tax=Pseudomonas sp. YH-1 TaxID=3384787 RepID=UPI003F7EF8E9
MSLSAQIFGTDSSIFKFNNIMLGGGPKIIDSLYRKIFPEPDTPSPTIPTVQESAYGNPIPRFYGMIGTAGNIIWLKGGKLDYTVKKKKSGGKGGGSSAATVTYSYFATFALCLGEGPIAGIRRMWCGDKLIYNAGSDDLETIIASNKAAKNWKLYLGTDDQMPDPDIEADKGVGNTPAYRGLAYIKFKRFALKDYGNSLAGAQFKVEVMSTSDMAVTSILSDRIPNYPSANNPDWNGQISYFSGESSLAYIGRWDNEYQTSLVDVYRVIAGRSFYQTTITASSNQPFAIGQSDEDSFVNGVSGTYHYWSSTYQNFTSISTYDYGATDARFVKNGDFIVFGGSNSTDGRLRKYRLVPYVLTGELEATSDPIERIGGLAYDSGKIYAVSAVSRKIYVFNEDLVLLEQFDYSASIGGFGSNTRIAVENGVIYLLTANLYVVTPTSYQLIWTIPVGYATSQANIISSGGVIIIWNAVQAGSRPYRQFYLAAPASPGVVTLADVVFDQCIRSELITAADIDVSLLTQPIQGYKLLGGSMRDAIEPLRTAYPFDLRMHGYKLQGLPRGQTSLVTVPAGDLAATDGDEISDALPYDWEMETQLPARVTAKGLSAVREYADASQSFDRISTAAVNTKTISLGLVLSDDELAQIAEMNCERTWEEEQQPFAFSLPPIYQAHEPGDVITLAPKFGVFPIRLTEVSTQPNGILECKGVKNNAALYSSNAVGAPSPGPGGKIPLDGPSVALLLDIPVVDETIQNTPGFVATMSGYTEGWSGGVLVQSPDGGQTWSDLQGFDGRGTFGRAAGTLPASNCTVIDQRSVIVSLISGELESVTRDQMLAGVNYAAYGADGRWEIVRFQNAALQADGTYLVSNFVRGQRGTEWATGLHQSGDWFILLDDPDNIFIGMPVESIGSARTYRAVTTGESIDTATDQAFTYRGVNLECLSPVYARGSRDSSSNFSGTFTRRSRLSSTWWTNGIAAPVGETSEAYEIDVMSGSTVKRTIHATSPAWSYLADDQTLDFGSPQSSITFRIFQISAVVGRGYPLEVTL